MNSVNFGEGVFLEFLTMDGQKYASIRFHLNGEKKYPFPNALVSGLFRFNDIDIQLKVINKYKSEILELNGKDWLNKETEKIQKEKEKIEEEQKRKEELERLKIEEEQKQKEEQERLQLERKKQLTERLKYYGIEYLVHFTNQDNLASILTNGLLSRDQLIKKNIPFVYSDKDRFDGRMNTVSLSVSFPNYKMLFNKNMTAKNIEWVIVFIDPQIICDLDCAFFSTNAAKKENSTQFWNNMSTVDSFNKMFEGDKRSPAIPSYYTSDPQAEIMVIGEIPVDYIKWICFATENKGKEFKKKYPQWEALYVYNNQINFFGPRCDDKMWED